MNGNIDLVISVVVLGFLTIMVVMSNATLMEGAVENGATHRLQTLAVNSINIIEEEVKFLDRIKVANNSDLEFVEKSSGETDSVDVVIYKQGSLLKVERTYRANGSTKSKEYNFKLDNISFTKIVHGTSTAPFLQVKLTVISSSDEQTRLDDQYKAVAEKNIYLKNLHVRNIYNQTN